MRRACIRRIIAIAVNYLINRLRDAHEPPNWQPGPIYWPIIGAFRQARLPASAMTDASRGRRPAVIDPADQGVPALGSLDVCWVCRVISGRLLDPRICRVVLSISLRHRLTNNNMADHITFTSPVQSQLIFPIFFICNSTRRDHDLTWDSISSEKESSTSGTVLTIKQ